MNIEELKAKYEKYIGTDEFMDHVFALKKDLLSSDSNDFLEYHYLLMNNKNLDSGERDLIKSFFYSEVVNERDKTKVGEFLLKKFEQEKTPQKQAELIKMLGYLRYSKVKKLAIQEIKSPEYAIRFASIIVLGWIGNSKDLGYLNERMLNDPEGTLRQCGAAAMRQIWFRHKSTKLKITQYINSAIRNEINPDALTGMIITIQDLYRKKLGIKEGHYGDLSGDVTKAKEKCIKELDKILTLKMKVFLYDIETDEEREPEEYTLDEALEEFYYLSEEEDSFLGIIDDEDRCIQFLFVSDNKWLVDIPRVAENYTLQKYADYDECVAMIKKVYELNKIVEFAGLKKHTLSA